MFKYLHSSKEEFWKGIKNLHVMYEKLTVFQFCKWNNQHIYKEKGEFTHIGTNAIWVLQLSLPGNSMMRHRAWAACHQHCQRWSCASWSDTRKSDGYGNRHLSACGHHKALPKYLPRQERYCKFSSPITGRIHFPFRLHISLWVSSVTPL